MLFHSNVAETPQEPNPCLYQPVVKLASLSVVSPKVAEPIKALSEDLLYLLLSLGHPIHPPV